MRFVRIINVDINLVTVEQLLEFLHTVITSNGHSVIAHANIHGINLAWNNKGMQSLYNLADIVFCDGYGVKFGAKMLGHDIPARITYADFAWDLASFAEIHGYSIYLLGGRPGIALRAATNLCKKHPKLKIVGVTHGYFNKAQNHKENVEVIQAINNVSPDILIVGFGMPIQERWLLDNWQSIDARVALTGGAVFDYVSGDMKRAPRWMTSHGFEWLARLVLEPRRLWKRYIVGNPLFMGRIIMQRIGFIK